MSYAGTMQTLDARHIELFLNEGYQDGSWDYETLGSHDTSKHADGASGGIFDMKHLKDQSTSGILFDFPNLFSCPLIYLYSTNNNTLCSQIQTTNVYFLKKSTHKISDFINVSIICL